MPSLVIRPRVDERGGLDLDLEKVIHLTNPITVYSLAAGMESGKPSVGFVFDLPDGKKVVAETSLELFISAARALAIAHVGEFADGIQG